MQASVAAYALHFKQAQVEHQMDMLSKQCEIDGLRASLMTSNTELDGLRAQSTEHAAAFQQLQAELVSARQQLWQAKRVARGREQVCMVPDPQLISRCCQQQNRMLHL
jgi:capsule polysaccharide export protein KpsE/RkpR